MAEPTLKDVLKAIVELDAKVDQKIDDVRREMATRRDVAEVRREQATIGALAELRRELVAKADAHRAETEAHRAETKKGFSDLDKELSGHTDVHREIEKDIAALKRRPARTAARDRADLGRVSDAIVGCANDGPTAGRLRDHERFARRPLPLDELIDACVRSDLSLARAPEAWRGRGRRREGG